MDVPGKLVLNGIYILGLYKPLILFVQKKTFFTERDFLGEIQRRSTRNAPQPLRYTAPVALRRALQRLVPLEAPDREGGCVWLYVGLEPSLGDL